MASAANPIILFCTNLLLQRNTVSNSSTTTTAASTFIGTVFQTILIKKLNMQTTLAFSANLVAALMINFVMRKFVIFKG